MKPEPKAKPASELPLQTAVEELAFLRKTFGEIVDAYAARLEGEITQMLALIAADAESKRKLPPERAADVRDILMVIRSLEVKPAKGRRRDLKKIENVIEELREIVDRW